MGDEELAVGTFLEWVTLLFVAGISVIGHYARPRWYVK